MKIYELNQVAKRALDFATRAHEGQVRKNSGVPYITHPIKVAHTLMENVDFNFTAHHQELWAAASLHDTIEDCGVTYDTIRNLFGTNIAEMVLGMTKVSKLSDGNRAVRKEIDRIHYSKQDKYVQTIKCADVFCNVSDYIKEDPKKAKSYGAECKKLIESLTNDPDPLMKAMALNVCEIAINGDL